MSLSPGDQYKFMVPVALDEMHDDPRYPRLTSLSQVRFVPEAQDGPNLRFFTASKIVITNMSTKRRVLEVDEARLICCLTDSRLVITYQDFAARGQWVGLGLGMLAAAGANYVNSRRAMRDQAGYEAAMHVRLQWINLITARSAAGLLKPELLGMVVRLGDVHFTIAIDLDKGAIKAGQVVNDLIRLTAKHWLTATLPPEHALTPEDTSALIAFGEKRVEPLPKGPIATAAVPFSFAITPATAQFFLGADA